VRGGGGVPACGVRDPAAGLPGGLQQAARLHSPGGAQLPQRAGLPALHRAHHQAVLRRPRDPSQHPLPPGGRQLRPAVWGSVALWGAHLPHPLPRPALQQQQYTVQPALPPAQGVWSSLPCPLPSWNALSRRPLHCTAPGVMRVWTQAVQHLLLGQHLLPDEHRPAGHQDVRPAAW